jgi:hypothetical protein
MASVGYSKRSRIEKLGVKPAMRVALLRVDDPDLRAELAALTEDVTEGRPRKGTAMVLLGLESVRDLARLAALEKLIARDGCIWALWPKGRKELKEDHVRAAAKSAGLVDVKVMAFSERLSGLKLVIPVARR